VGRAELVAAQDGDWGAARRPYERFTITRRTEIETIVLLLVIGVAVTKIAVWGRRHYAIASRRAGYWRASTTRRGR
jgi:hypothetical protein